MFSVYSHPFNEMYFSAVCSLLALYFDWAIWLVNRYIHQYQLRTDVTVKNMSRMSYHLDLQNILALLN